MPVFLLCVHAELENVGILSLKPGASFCLDVKESAGSEVREGIHVLPHEQHELAGSRGTANFVMKFCKESKSQCYVNVMDLKGVTRSFTAEDSEKGRFVPIAAFECRGLDLIGFRPEGDWLVEASESGCKWDDVDLSEGEWTEYDEKAGVSVGVYNIRSQFTLHKM